MADSSNPGTFEDLAELVPAYLRWLEVRGYAAATIRGRRSNLRHFCTWSKAKGITRPGEVTQSSLEDYQSALYDARKADGTPLGYGTQAHRLVAVRRYLDWLHRMRYLSHNPGASIELPRRPHRIPRAVLTAEEAESVLALPEVGCPVGLRDRAILELFYSSGPRRSELCHLDVSDLDRNRRLLLIREGKGRRDRMVPVSERALGWLERYLVDARPVLVRDSDPGRLFLSQRGGPLRPKRLSGLVSVYVERADLGKRGSCHLFRHTLATLMLEGGASLRHVQEMLGHTDLRSTEIYTHVALGQLQAVHGQTHPGARMHGDGEGLNAQAGNAMRVRA